MRASNGWLFVMGSLENEKLRTTNYKTQSSGKIYCPVSLGIYSNLDSIGSWNTHKHKSINISIDKCKYY